MEDGLMTFDRWLTLGSLIVAFMAVVLNWKRGNSMGMLERGQYLESVNKSIEMANKRAMSAEERVVEVEKESLIREKKLEDRIEVLESKLSYRLTFDVKLGPEPSIEHVHIEHYPERRSNPDDRFTGKNKRLSL